jgi:hypothetical protein
VALLPSWPVTSRYRELGSKAVAAGSGFVCQKTQRMIFDMLPANDKNTRDSADIVCDECKSIIATLHAE